MKYPVVSPQLVVLGRSNLDTFDQSSKHPLNFDDNFFRLRLLCRGHDSKIVREIQKIFHLACGSHGHVQESLEIQSAPSSGSFRDVRRNRVRGTANLGSKSKPFLIRETAASLVNAQRQGMAFCQTAKRLKKSCMTAPLNFILLMTGD